MDTKKNVQVVTQLPRIYVWNQKIQKKDNMMIKREDIENILSYYDFSRLYNAISQFPELIPEFLRNRITFPLPKSKISIEWRFFRFKL